MLARWQVEVNETIALIGQALKGEMTIDHLYQAVERSKSVVSKAISKAIEKGLILRTGSGKKGDPYKYSSLPPSYINGGGKEETKTASNAAENNEEIPPRLFDENENPPAGIRGAILRAFLGGGKNAQEVEAKTTV